MGSATMVNGRTRSWKESREKSQFRGIMLDSLRFPLPWRGGYKGCGRHRSSSLAFPKEEILLSKYRDFVISLLQTTLWSPRYGCLPWNEPVACLGPPAPLIEDIPYKPKRRNIWWKIKISMSYKSTSNWSTVNQTPTLQESKSKALFFLQMGQHNYCFVILPFGSWRTALWGVQFLPEAAGQHVSFMPWGRWESSSDPRTKAFRNCMCAPVL